MEGIWKFLMGPWLIVCLIFMLGGLARIVFVQGLELYLAYRICRDRKQTWTARAEWFLREMWRSSPRLTLPPAATILSLIFYTAVIFIAAFLADHIAFWGGRFAHDRPGFEKEIADWAALLALAAGGAVMLVRGLHPASRRASSLTDYVLLVLLMGAMVSGYIAAHPRLLLVSYVNMMTIHAVLGEAALILLPFSGLAWRVLHPVRAEDIEPPRPVAERAEVTGTVPGGLPSPGGGG